VIVFPRCLSVNDVFARADDGVATRRATRADAFRFFQEPDAHLETKIARRECTHRADIDGVERVIVLEALAGMRSQHGITAAIDKPKDVVVCDLLAKTDAPRAENATLVIKRDTRTKHYVLGFLDLVFEKTRL
jgi:hypothetical protein